MDTLTNDQAAFLLEGHDIDGVDAVKVIDNIDETSLEARGSLLSIIQLKVCTEMKDGTTEHEANVKVSMRAGKGYRHVVGSGNSMPSAVHNAFQRAAEDAGVSASMLQGHLLRELQGTAEARMLWSDARGERYWMTEGTGTDAIGAIAAAILRNAHFRLQELHEAEKLAVRS